MNKFEQLTKKNLPKPVLGEAGGLRIGLARYHRRAKGKGINAQNLRDLDHFCRPRAIGAFDVGNRGLLDARETRKLDLGHAQFFPAGSHFFADHHLSIFPKIANVLYVDKTFCFRYICAMDLPKMIAQLSARGLTQAEIGRLSGGLSQSVISSVLHKTYGSKKPSFRLVTGLQAALKATAHLKPTKPKARRGRKAGA